MKAIVMSAGSILASIVLASLPFIHPELDLMPHLIYPIVIFIVLGLIISLYTLVFLTVNKQANKARDQRLRKQKTLANQMTMAKLEISNQNEEHDDNLKPEKVALSDKGSKKVEISTTETSNNAQSLANLGKEKHIMEEMRDKTVKILISVTLVYIFCFVPSSVINFCFFITTESFFYMSSFPAFIIKTLQLGYYLNFALSPIVYAALSGRFREDTRVIILKREPRSVRDRKMTMVTREGDV